MRRYHSSYISYVFTAYLCCYPPLQGSVSLSNAGYTTVPACNPVYRRHPSSLHLVFWFSRWVVVSVSYCIWRLSWPQCTLFQLILKVSLSCLWSMVNDSLQIITGYLTNINVYLRYSCCPLILIMRFTPVRSHTLLFWKVFWYGSRSQVLDMSLDQSAEW